MEVKLNEAEAAVNTLDHLARLDINGNVLPRKTSIIATLGPSTNSVEILSDMILSGMTIARLNLSHGSYQEHYESIQKVREAEKAHDFIWPVAIAVDTRGPKIRTGFLKGGISSTIDLNRGDDVCLTTNAEFENCSDLDHLYISYASLCDIVSVGDYIYIDDGLLRLKVKSINGCEVCCSAETCGVLGSRKGVSIPDSEMHLPSLSHKDIEDLNFGVENQVDYIFVSFTNSSDDIRKIRGALGPRGKNIKIIAKIENGQGLKELDGILKEADGVMVARGDLGVEIPLHKICTAQKMIIAKCNMVGKPVICASQMLESMTHNPRPTRAEVSDVANAVFDGCDCIMLSGESAIGKYPVKCVQLMDAIARQAESSMFYKQYFESITYFNPPPLQSAVAIAIAAVEASFEVNAPVILVLTTTGKSAIEIAKFRPRANILAVTRSIATARYLNLFRACHPVFIKEPRVGGELIVPSPNFPGYQTKVFYSELSTDAWMADVDFRVRKALSLAVQNKFISKGDVVIVVTGWHAGSGLTNTIRIIHCE